MNVPMRAAMTLYGAAISAAVHGVLAPVERFESLLGRRPTDVLDERLGRVIPGPARRPWLIHAVSVGEMRAAAALVDALAACPVQNPVVLTTGNRDGRAAGERLRLTRPSIASVSHLPWDRPRVVIRWLKALDPAAVLVVETELWPGLFLASRELGIPLFVVSGRLSEREARRYRLARAFFKPVLAAARGIAVQTEDDRERFVSIGADLGRIQVFGNLKFDAAPEPITGGSAQLIHGRFLVAGSTHAPEESWLFAAFTRLRTTRPELRLVLAPRHPARAGVILREAQAAGFTARTLSSAVGDEEVVVVDSLGALPDLYTRATVAFVGGSLMPRGGQSPIEPAASGVPLVMGSSDENFKDISARLASAGALLRVPAGEAPIDGLVRAVGSLLDDEADRARRGLRAREVFEQDRGGAKKTVDWLLGELR